MSTARPLAYAYLVGSLMPDDLLEAGAELLDGINLTRPAWHTEGACRLPEHRHVDFYPERGRSTEPAKRVCSGCSVREDCLSWAIDHGEKVGVWGGLSERERRRIRAQRQRNGRTITERRRLVLELRTEGLSHREIGERLGVGHRTVGLDLRALEASVVVSAGSAS